MNISINYNDKIDEFTLDLTLQMRLERYIKEHFYPAHVISHFCHIYLVGGSIRDLIMAKHPKDLDFVVLGNENLEWLKEVLKKYNIEYSLNSFGGMKFNYNDMSIDLWTTDDLFSSMQYNVDGLYYDLISKSLVSLTFSDFSQNGIREINPNNNIENGRIKKLINFQRQYKNDSVKRLRFFVK